MAQSTITITFNSDLVADDQVYFEQKYNNGSIASDWMPVVETWKNQRLAVNQVTIGTPTGTPGERSAVNFAQSLNLDYSFNYSENGELLNGVSVAGNVVTITVDTVWTFQLGVSNPTDEDVDIVISNFESPLLTITDLVFDDATTNPVCTHYKATITANQNIDQYSVNHGAVVEHDGTTLELEFLRGQAMSFTLIGDDDQQVSRSYTIDQIPAILNSALLYELQINNSPNGATIVVNMYDAGILDYEFSLDNSNWQTSNEFNGLLPDDYTLYIRDQFGCSFTREFTVDEFGSRTPYFLMPKSNSIRFKNNIVWGDCANYKTDENTLSCEADVKLPYKEIQQFQSCDIITTQYRSSYTTNTAKVVEQDGTETAVTVNKMTNNMGLKDSRDARKYNLGNGKTGVYFTDGNLYDFDTSVDTGDDYVLNGALPEWATAGTYFKMGSSWYLIEDILFDENVRAEVIVFSNDYTGEDAPVVVGSIYNRENYDEFEFTIDFLDYLNKRVQVHVIAEDDSFDNLEQISEVIDVKVRQVGTYEFKWKNSTNTDINYSRGIEHKIRLMVEKITASPNDESETHLTDTDAVLLSSEIHEIDTVLFSPMTTQMMRKVVQIFAHDTVKMNGIPYTKNGAITVEGPLEDTNLYDVTVNLIKGANVFNSQSGDGSNTFAGDSIEIPGLVEHDGGVVKYQ